MAIVLYESFRAVFYLPFYLAHALGAYEAEDVPVTLGTSPDLDSVAAQLRSGEADVYWGGPMRIMMNHDRDPDCAIVGFCEAVSRDPFLLIGREPRPQFRIADLTEVTLATVSEVPTPWMCLQDDLRREGIDPDGIRRVADQSMADNAAALQDGAIDAAQLFQPDAERLLRDGTGHLWYAAATRGLCSYTTLYTTREMASRRRDDLHRMTRAMFRTQKWLHARSESEIADAVSDYFPDIPQDLLAAAIRRYLDLGVWGRNPVLARDGFDRLRQALLSGGLIRREMTYEDCVDMRFADAVVAEDPPGL